MVKVGIIGGSGLEDPDILKDPIIRETSTRFGAPSSALISGCIDGVDVVLLSRHGKDHTITPTGVPNRANLVALKEAGCTHLVTTTAVGSLREEIGRGDLVIVDQFIDFTRHRDVTLFDSFEDGLHHTPMADPFDRGLRELLLATAREMGVRVHPTGTVVTIEGPRFSTRAESRMFRAWGADIINMSIAPECILANELGLPYATIAMSTDYDCWKEDEAPVTWEAVLRTFQENADKVKRLLLQAIPSIH